MKYMELTSSSIVVPQQVKGRPFWGTQGLGRGSIVGVMKYNLPSPLTGRTNEMLVKWKDVAGRETLGWLADKTPMKRSSVKSLRHVSNTERLTAWGNLRAQIMAHEGWDAEKWIQRFANETNLPLLHAVIRQLGGKVPHSDDPITAAKCCIRLITGKELQMKGSKKTAEATTTATKTATKKTAKKGGAKKSARKGEGNGPGRTSAFAGKRIVRLVKGNPRREGTFGFKSWNKLTKGMTYEQYIAAGGRRVDLAWDLQKGNVKLVNA